MTYNRADHRCPCCGAKAVRVICSRVLVRYGKCQHCSTPLQMKNDNGIWEMAAKRKSRTCPECGDAVKRQTAKAGVAYYKCSNGHHSRRMTGEDLMVLYTPKVSKYETDEEREAAKRESKRRWDDAHRKSDKPKRVPLPPCPDCSGKLYAYLGGRDENGVQLYYCQSCKAKWQRARGVYEVQPREYCKLLSIPPCPACGGKCAQHRYKSEVDGIKRYKCKECERQWHFDGGKYTEAPVVSKSRTVTEQKPVPKPRPVKQSAKPVAKPAPIIKQASQPKPVPKPARKGQLSLASRLDDLREHRALQQNDLW